MRDEYEGSAPEAPAAARTAYDSCAVCSAYGDAAEGGCLNRYGVDGCGTLRDSEREHGTTDTLMRGTCRPATAEVESEHTFNTPRNMMRGVSTQSLP